MLVCTLWLAVAFCLAQYGVQQFVYHITEGFSMPCASLHLIVRAMQHEDANRNPDSPLHKKQRHMWTSEAHHEFANIVERLGDSKQACQPLSFWSRRICVPIFLSTMLSKDVVYYVSMCTQVEGNLSISYRAKQCNASCRGCSHAHSEIDAREWAHQGAGGKPFTGGSRL